jgi:23S rRNA pseudouridine2605 synthase
VRNDPRFLVQDRAAVEVDGRRVGPPRGAGRAVYLMLNKPRGVVTTTRDPEGRRTVMDLVGADVAPGLAPVGRLDKASAGLLLLTNDHAWADAVLDPRRHVLKTYRVKVRGHPTAATLARWREETLVEDGLVLGPLDVAVESRGPKSAWLLVRLREGKNRQVRRRMEAEGHEVEVLVRRAIGPVELGDLPPGAVRPLAPREVEALRRPGARLPHGPPR